MKNNTTLEMYSRCDSVIVHGKCFFFEKKKLILISLPKEFQFSLILLWLFVKIFGLKSLQCHDDI